MNQINKISEQAENDLNKIINEFFTSKVEAKVEFLKQELTKSSEDIKMQMQVLIDTIDKLPSKNYLEKNIKAKIEDLVEQKISELSDKYENNLNIIQKENTNLVEIINNSNLELKEFNKHETFQFKKKVFLFFSASFLVYVSFFSYILYIILSSR